MGLKLGTLTLALCVSGAALAADTRLVDGPVFAAQLPDANGVIEIVEPAPGRIVTGLAFSGTTDGPCRLDITHAAPATPTDTEVLRHDLCDGAETGEAKALAVSDGHVVIAVALCLDSALSQMEGLALSTLPDYCAADPDLWSERDTGQPFRLRIKTQDGFLRPPFSYARPCTSGTVQRTLSVARPGCKRWQPRSACPTHHVMTGVVLASTQTAGAGRVISGLAVRCQELETDH